MAPKARWLLSHGQSGARPARFHQPVSYLVERLTGEAVIDHGMASTSLVYDLKTGAYAGDLLDLFGLKRRRSFRASIAARRWPASSAPAGQR